MEDWPAVVEESDGAADVDDERGRLGVTSAADVAEAALGFEVEIDDVLGGHGRRLSFPAAPRQPRSRGFPCRSVTKRRLIRPTR